ncbi:MAG: MBL fold metallo-hydrolase [bacterium]|nr:MBL fold metallo-hydrolase [bacterium]
MGQSSVRIINLGSGSKGNCSLVVNGHKSLLVDCGLSARQVFLRMQRLSLDPYSVCGILVTHEHSDHIKGALKCSRDMGAPVWATTGTISGGNLDAVGARAVNCGSKFSIEDFHITPVSISHDTREPCAFLVEAAGLRSLFATDMGTSEGLNTAVLTDLDHLYIEANHDVEMLRFGHYPAFLKKRISGPKGHLSNGECGDLVNRLAGQSPRLRAVMLAHLSDKNNQPDLAMKTVLTHAGSLPKVKWSMACQDEATEMW